MLDKESPGKTGLTRRSWACLSQGHGRRWQVHGGANPGAWDARSQLMRLVENSCKPPSSGFAIDKSQQDEIHCEAVLVLTQTLQI